jgi:hypothetical protein
MPLPARPKIWTDYPAGFDFLLKVGDGMGDLVICRPGCYERGASVRRQPLRVSPHLLL